MTDLVRSLVKRHEGLSLRPYRDTLGVLTIGYGRNLDAVGILPEEADHMLDRDLARAEASASSFAGPCWATLPVTRRAVLTDMAFQLGASGLSRFRRLRAALDAGDVQAAAREIGTSRAAGQCPARYAELVALWLQQ